MLRILYDDFDQKVKNIHDEMDLHHSYKIKSVYTCKFLQERDFVKTNKLNARIKELQNVDIVTSVYVGE